MGSPGPCVFMDMLGDILSQWPDSGQAQAETWEIHGAEGPRMCELGQITGTRVLEELGRTLWVPWWPEPCAEGDLGQLVSPLHISASPPVKRTLWCFFSSALSSAGKLNEQFFCWWFSKPLINL